MSDFGGRNQDSILIPELIETLVGATGQPFSEDTEAISMGLRAESEVGWEDASTKAAMELEAKDAINHTCKLVTLQSGWPQVKNAYLLGKKSRQMRLKTADNLSLNYVRPLDETTVDPTAPGCSQTMGFTWNLVIGMTARSLTLNGKTRMLKTEHDWFISQMSTPATGGTGTDTGLLTPNAYDLAEYSIPGIERIEIDGHDVGEFKDAQVTLDGEETTMLSRTQSICRKIKLGGYIDALQMKASDLAAISTHTGILTVPMIVYLSDGKTIKYNTGTISVKAKGSLGDKEAFTKLTIAGAVGNNSNEATPDSIDIGVGDADVLELTQRAFA